MSLLEPLRHGDLIVDPQARAVSFDGESVNLTRREFDILATLAAHPGWVYSSEALATADPVFYGSPSSVNVHVARVRKKLAAAGCCGLVETVRGVGYRLASKSSSKALVTVDPFVGRRRELAVLETALSRVLSVSESRFVLIAGEAGIGKSRIAEQFERHAVREGAEVLWGRPAESGAPPYVGWTEMLRELVDGHDPLDGFVLAPSVMALARPVPEPSVSDIDLWESARLISPSEARFVLYDGVTRALTHESLRRPIVLVFDDLQWASAETLALLQFVLKNLARSRVLVVGLCRDEASGSPALDLLLSECAGRRQTACMEVRGLTAADVELLAVASGVEGVDRAMAAAIHSRTQGNALFVSELLQMIAMEGESRRVQSSRLAALMPTPNMRSLVRGRLGRMGSAAVGLLESAAVLGLEFSLPVLERLCEADRASVLDALGEALDGGILSPCDEPELLQFRHALVQQVIYLEVPAATRMRLHGRAGDVLAEGRDHDASRITAIARHYRNAASAGYAEKAVDYALAAGRSAKRLLGFETAAGQFEYARLLIATETEISWRPGLLAQVAEEWGDALVASAHLVAAVGAYREAVVRSSDTEHVTLGRLLGKIGQLLTEARDWKGAHEAFRQAAVELHAVPEVGRHEEWRHARVTSEVALMTLLYYELDDAGMERWISEVGDEIERIADPVELTDYLGVVVLWSILRDHNWPSDATVAIARRGHTVAESAGSQSRSAMAVTLLGYALLWNGQLGEARAKLEEGVSQGEHVGAHTAAMIALAALSCLDRIEGDTAAARQSAARCESRAIELGSRGEFGAMGAANLAWTSLRDGDREGARGHAARAFEGWSLAPTFSFKWAAAWPLMAVELLDGNDDAAIANARVLLEPGAQAPQGEAAGVIADALTAADVGDRTSAIAGLRHAVELGRDFGYT